MVRILQGVSPSICDHNFSYGRKWTATGGGRGAAAGDPRAGEFQLKPPGLTGDAHFAHMVTFRARRPVLKFSSSMMVPMPMPMKQ